MRFKVLRIISIAFVLGMFFALPLKAQYYPFYQKERALKSYSHYEVYDAIRERYVVTKDINAAVASLDSLALLLQASDPHQYLFLKNEISNLRKMHNQLEESAEDLYRAMKWFVERADTVHMEYSTSLRLIRTVLPFYKKPRFREVRSLFEANFFILEKLNVKGEPLNNLLVDYANFLLGSGNLSEGLEAMYKARSAAAGSGDLLSMVMADYSLIGWINNNDLQQTIVEILKSNLELLGKQKKAISVLAYTNYYNYFTGQKYYDSFRNLDQAIIYMKRAVDCLDTLNYPMWNLNANANAEMALYLAQKGGYEACAENFMKARLYAETKPMSAYNKSLVFSRLGEAAMFFSADSVLQLVEVAKTLPGYKNFMFHVLDLEARAWQQKGMYAKAIEVIEGVFEELLPGDGFSIPVMDKEADYVTQLTLLSHLEISHRSLFAEQGAVSSLVASVYFIDEITRVVINFLSDEIHSHEVPLELSDYNRFSKSATGFLVEQNKKGAYNDKLFNLFASSKALQLSAGLNKSHFQSEIEKDKEGFGSLLRNVGEIQRVKNELARNGLEEDTQLAFNKDLNALLVENLMLKYRFFERAQNSSASFQVPDLAQVQSVLKPGEAILEYMVDDTAIFWMFCSSDKLVFGGEDVGDSDRALSEVLYSIKTGRQRVKADFLFPSDLLEQLSQVERLIIVPDKKMVLFPFEALLLPSTDDYLVVSHEIAYSYSTTLWYQMMKDAKPRLVNEFLAVAPVFSKEPFKDIQNEAFVAYRGHETLTPLLHSKLETGHLARLGKKHKKQVKSLIGKEATERGLRKHIEKADVVHLATHGIVNKDNHERSGLYLFPEEGKLKSESATDDFLSLGELLSLRLKADLVVLSACNTGVGGLADGEGVMALPRGFIFAGVPNVVASLWRVHDEKTSEFMQAFYNQLFAGNSYSRALQLARMECINKGWLPIDWAGFVLIGQ